MKNKVDVTLWEWNWIELNIHKIFDSCKLWKSLTDEAKPFVLWGINDWKYYKILGLDVYEADIIEYAKSMLSDFRIYDQIKNFISNENYDCLKIDYIEKNLTIDDIIEIGWEKISSMTIEELEKLV